jgi:NADH-quinone oxidoreductase subunit J
VQWGFESLFSCSFSGFFLNLLMLSLSSPFLLQFLGAFIGGTCLLVVGVQNPIHSLLLLIRVFVIGTLLLFTLQREYFAILFLIVYVGAIVVLFLFVIRRLEIKRVNVARRFRDIISYRHLAVALLALEVLLLASQDVFDLSPFLTGFSELPALTERNGYVNWAKLLHRSDPLRALGGLLYTEYGTTLIIAALLLTIARVGAIGITLVPRTTPTPVENSEQSALSVPTNLSAPRTIKRQEGEHQARRHPALLATSLRTGTRRD